jgi:hypothetical protein
MRLPENDLLVRVEDDFLLRYIRYMRRCEEILVRPASFDLWHQIEPWLIERGRIAVLEVLRADLLHRENADSISQAFAS